MNTVNFLNLEYLFLVLFNFFKNFDIIAILNWLLYWITRFFPLLIIIGLFLVFVIVYSRVKLDKIEKDEEAKFHAKRYKDAKHEAGRDPIANQKWLEVEAHINSNNPSDWRLAIIEADIMLDSLLEHMGYQGDSIGDKLKGVNKAEFVTLDLAWEAHKVRNQIAHEGSDYLLNERDAKKTIEQFRKVFQEFFYI